MVCSALNQRLILEELEPCLDLTNTIQVLALPRKKWIISSNKERLFFSISNSNLVAGLQPEFPFHPSFNPLTVVSPVSLLFSCVMIKHSAAVKLMSSSLDVLLLLSPGGNVNGSTFLFSQ